jgi:hypothetical protein
MRQQSIAIGAFAASGLAACDSASASYLLGAADPSPNNLRATVVQVFEKEMEP